MTKNSESPATTINGQTALIPANDKGNEVMSIGQLNEYLVKRSAVICEYVRKKRAELPKGKIPHTSDVIPPLCYSETTLKENIKNLMACFSNTLVAALSSETMYIQTLENFEALGSIVEAEKFLIFEFLRENGLTGKFNEFMKGRAV